MLNIFFQNRSKVLLVMVSSLIMSIAIFFSNTTPTSSKDNSELTPTVFVHGFKGGPGSFNTMLERFQDDRLGVKQMMIRVSPKGKLSVRGRILEDKNPFIQVIFEHNRASVEDQTLWMKKVMKTLHENYGIKQVNLVGHSMGGLASTNFLLNNETATYPKVKKLVVMGSPFKGIEQKDYFEQNFGDATFDLQVKSKALTDMIEQKSKFDDKVDVLAIAGVISKDPSVGDGLVSLSSALGIRDIVPSDNYSEEVFYDYDATHSGLHEHLEVDKTLAKFLWNIQTN